ncbi:MAG TPA: hypothetical protein VEZ11_05305 [Thermoanaerobaculia bacterium]|nr:hypothetical protein [Thermoanaerobaculia bacterium]
MSDRIVTLAHYDRVDDAEVAHNALEAAGIDSVFAGENIVRAEPITLRVREDDADQAKAVLRRVGLGEFAVADESEDIEPEPEELDQCAACGSADFRRVPKLFIFVALLTAVAGIGGAIGDIFSPAVFLLLASAAMLVLLEDNWRCRECGHGWR